MVLSESQVDLICKKPNYEPLSQCNTCLIKTFEILYEQLKLKYLNLIFLSTLLKFLKTFPSNSMNNDERSKILLKRNL